MERREGMGCFPIRTGSAGIGQSKAQREGWVGLSALGRFLGIETWGVAPGYNGGAPLALYDSGTWGVAPGYYGGAPLALYDSDIWDVPRLPWRRDFGAFAIRKFAAKSPDIRSIQMATPTLNHRIMLQVAGGLIALPVLYALSIGPVYWVGDKYVPGMVHNGNGWFDDFYRPLLGLAESSPAFVFVFDRYMAFWTPRHYGRGPAASGGGE